MFSDWRFPTILTGITRQLRAQGVTLVVFRRAEGVAHIRRRPMWRLRLIKCAIALTTKSYLVELQTDFCVYGAFLDKVQQGCSSCRVSAPSFNYYLIKAELTTTAVAPPATVLGGYPGAFHLRSRRYFIIFAFVVEAWEGGWCDLHS